MWGSSLVPQFAIAEKLIPTNIESKLISRSAECKRGDITTLSGPCAKALLVQIGFDLIVP